MSAVDYKGLVSRLDAEPDSVIGDVLELAKSSDDEKRTELVEEGIVLPLLNVVAAEDKGNLKAQAANTIAELAKSEASRPKIGATVGLAGALVKCLSGSDSETKLQCLRALGNLVFENDENRAILMEADVIPELVLAIEGQDAAIQRTAAGVSQNLVAGGDDTIAKKYVDAGGLQALLAVAQGTNSDNVYFALKALTSLHCEATAQPLAEALPALLIKMFETDDEENLEASLGLATAMATSDDVKKRLVNLGALPVLLKVAATALASESSLEEAEDEEDVAVLSTGLLATFALEDSCMQTMAEAHMLSEFLRFASTTKRNLVLKNCLMAVGNMARNDAQCESLVAEDGGADVILRNVLNENVEVQYMAAGVMRNLTLLDKNKSILVGMGAHEKISTLVLGAHEPMQFYGAGAIRNLAKGHPEIASEICKVEGLVAKLANLGANKEPEQIWIESTRAMLTLMAPKEESVLRLVVKSSGVKALTRLLGSNFDVLRAEALLALTWLCDAGLSQEVLSEGEQLKAQLATLSENVDSKDGGDVIVLAQALLAKLP